MKRIGNFHIGLLIFGIFTVGILMALFTCQDPICKKYRKWESDLNYSQLLPTQTKIIRKWQQQQILTRKYGHYENHAAPTYSYPESKYYLKLKNELARCRQELDSMLNNVNLILAKKQ